LHALTDSLSDRIGRRRFLVGAGAVAGAGIVGATLPATVTQAAPTAASAFAPLPNAVRVVDTRDPGNYTFDRLANNRIRLHLGGNHGIPATASAVVATVTAVNDQLPNYVSVFPSGANIPVVSNLNLPNPNDINANLVTVKLGAGGSTKGAVDVFTRVPCHVIVDVIGFYDPVAGAVKAGRFIGLPSAQRAIDTRPNLVGSGSVTTVDLTKYVPANASSVVINLTATECTGAGYFTVFPDAEQNPPSTSSLNVTYNGATRAAAVIAPVTNHGGRQRIKIFSLTAAKLIVDVVGYFTGPNSGSSEVGLFVPVDPVRVLDTREPGQIGKLWPRWVVEGKVPGDGASEASAIVANLTGADTRGPGYVTISAARRPIPGTSSANWTFAGAVVPNHAITPITHVHGFQVYSSHGCNVLVDYAGYFTGSPAIPTLAAYVNPAPPVIAPPWRLVVPRFGLDSWVYGGDANQIVDRGDTWHWTGTGDMGQEANVAVFGHRTEHGGPYRHIDSMQVGDLFYVLTLDGREYTYRMTRRDLTDAQNPNILNAVRTHSAPSFSMVACTVGYDRSKSRYPDAWAPTSLKYRIVVTGELESWREI